MIYGKLTLVVAHGGSIDKTYQINHRIKYPKLRVILGTGENLGVLTTQEALKVAEEHDLDVVVITENTDPPVARIVDFNKFLYAEKKKASETRGKSKQTEIKELRLSPTISGGDITQRANRAKEFLSNGNMVKVTLTMKGRQALHPEVAQDKMKQFSAQIQAFAKAEADIRRVGNTLSIIFVKK